MNNKERNVYLDITRIVAVLAVIMIHISAEFVVCHNPKSIEFVWGNIFDSISRIGVPLFIMISGALMLDENRIITTKNLIFKNVKIAACLLVFWSAVYSGIYNVLFPLAQGEQLNVRTIITSFILGHFHLWYLYMIIGLYVITPFLREFVKKENKKLVQLFIAISIGTQFIVPILNAVSLVWKDAKILLSFVNQFNFDFFSVYITYYLIGWYIIQIGIKRKWIFYCLGIISLLTIIVYVQITKNYNTAYLNENVLVLLYSVSVFLALNSTSMSNKNEKLNKLIEVLSKLSFGVYIIHPLVLSIYNKVISYSKVPVIFILICFIVVTAISFIGCYIVSKLPIVKKTIRM